MSITIQIQHVEVTGVPGKKYKKANVTYLTSDGKVEGRNIMDFVNKDVWESITNSKKGDWFDIDLEKDPTGKYWNWIGIHRQDKPPVVEKKVNTYEEKNALDKERFSFEKVKQPLIIRQSSISSAVAYMAAFANGSKFSPEQVVSVAKVFERYVNGDDMHDVTEDIPQ